MIYTQEELQQAARRLIHRHLEGFEFLDIVEDEDYSQLSEDQQGELFDLVNDATVVIGWITK